jgi:hypothetical protein
LDRTDPKIAKARLVFSNSGQTPAYDLQGWIHTWLAPHPLEHSLPEPEGDFQMGTHTLGPGCTTDFIGEYRLLPHSEMLNIFGTPSATLYVYGRFTYKDVFGKQHATNYRLMFGRETRRAPGRTDEKYVLSPDIEGNDSD